MNRMSGRSRILKKSSDAIEASGEGEERKDEWEGSHCEEVCYWMMMTYGKEGRKLPFFDQNNIEASSEVIRTFTRRKQVSRLTSLPEEDDYNLDIPKRRAEVTLNQLRANCYPLTPLHRSRHLLQIP